MGEEEEKGQVLLHCARMQLGAREAASSGVKMQYSSCPFMPHTELEITGRNPPTVVRGGLEMAATWPPCLQPIVRRQAKARCSKSSLDFIVQHTEAKQFLDSGSLSSSRLLGA